MAVPVHWGFVSWVSLQQEPCYLESIVKLPFLKNSHINIRNLLTMPQTCGLRSKMLNPHVHVVFGAQNLELNGKLQLKL